MGGDTVLGTPVHPRLVRGRALVSTLLALVALGSLYPIVARDPLARDAGSVGPIPVEVFAPPDAVDRRPAVVLAHGFAGSKQSMYDFGRALATAGYVAVVFDFSGHGANPHPLSSDRAFDQLGNDLRDVVTFARALPYVDPNRVALLGHSMGARVVVAYAQEHLEIAATVALSGGRADVTPDEPRNLLLMAGAWEPGGLKRMQATALANAGGASADFATGRARDAREIPTADHLAILWNHEAQIQAARWMRRAMPLPELGSLGPETDHHMRWVLAFSLAAAVLFLPLSAGAVRGLHLRDGGAARASVPYGKMLAAFGIPALVVPLALHLVHRSAFDLAALVPIQLVGYVAAYWLLYALVAGAVASALGVMPRVRLRRGSLVGAGCLVAWVGATIGLVGHRTWINLLPGGTRPTWLAVVFLLSAPYFVLSEHLVRAETVRRGVVNDLTGKAILLASLALSAALNPQLASLLLVAPVFVAVFVLFGVYGAWTFALTGDPLIAGLGAAATISALLVAGCPLLA